MKYFFYYGSIAIAWLLFLWAAGRKKPGLHDILIGIVSVAFSLAFEILLGTYARLYYYIDPPYDIPYMVAASILLYPLLNTLYVLFLPKKTKTALLYTVFWIAAMLVFEWASILTGTVVLTGWKMVPYSYLTYVLTYSWIYPLYRYLNSKYKIEEAKAYR